MYKKILVPLDGSKLAESVLPHMESIASGCGAQDVIFLRVVEPINVPISDGVYAFGAEYWKQLESNSIAAAESYLGQLVSRAKYDGINLRSEVITGKAADIIAEYATKNEVDLIIIATHGLSGVSRWVLGSVADKVLRSACVPVLMVRAPGCVPGIWDKQGSN